jgi:hypothetical protein
MSGGAADHFKRLRGLYRSCFCGDDGEVHRAGREVIENLRQMTKYGSSPFSTDPVRMAYQVGQQDVMLHLMKMLNITDAEIHRLTASQPATYDEGENY